MSPVAAAKQIVGVADMRISDGGGVVLVTHALGSCLGLTAYDETSRVGGLLHVMLPSSRINPDKAKVNPFMFVDTGVPAFFRAIYAAGGVKRRLRVSVAGGANVHRSENDRFAIGKRNYLTLKKMLWKNGVLINAEDVGGAHARTMYLAIDTGRVWVSTAGRETQL